MSCRSWRRGGKKKKGWCALHRLRGGARQGGSHTYAGLIDDKDGGHRQVSKVLKGLNIRGRIVLGELYSGGKKREGREDVVWGGVT